MREATSTESFVRPYIRINVRNSVCIYVRYDIYGSSEHFSIAMFHIFDTRCVDYRRSGENFRQQQQQPVTGDEVDFSRTNLSHSSRADKTEKDR